MELIKYTTYVTIFRVTYQKIYSDIKSKSTNLNNLAVNTLPSTTGLNESIVLHENNRTIIYVGPFLTLVHKQHRAQFSVKLKTCITSCHLLKKKSLFSVLSVQCSQKIYTLSWLSFHSNQVKWSRIPAGFKSDLILSSTIGSQATGCEIHFKGQSKESQLLSTEKQDKAKVTAVRYFHCHSSLFSTCTLILILVTWHCFPHLQTLKMFQDNGPSYIMHTFYSFIYVFIFR